MLQRLKNSLRKPARLLTLMTGVAFAPLASRGQTDIEEALRFFEEQDQMNAVAVQEVHPDKPSETKFEKKEYPKLPDSVPSDFKEPITVGDRTVQDALDADLLKACEGTKISPNEDEVLDQLMKQLREDAPTLFENPVIPSVDTEKTLPEVAPEITEDSSRNNLNVGERTSLDNDVLPAEPTVQPVGEIQPSNSNGTAIDTKPIDEILSDIIVRNAIQECINGNTSEEPVVESVAQQPVVENLTQPVETEEPVVESVAQQPAIESLAQPVKTNTTQDVIMPVDPLPKKETKFVVSKPVQSHQSNSLKGRDILVGLGIFASVVLGGLWMTRSSDKKKKKPTFVRKTKPSMDVSQENIASKTKMDLSTPSKPVEQKISQENVLVKQEIQAENPKPIKKQEPVVIDKNKKVIPSLIKTEHELDFKYDWYVEHARAASQKSELQNAQVKSAASVSAQVTQIIQSNGLNDVATRLKGIRLLANIKAKRSALTGQKKMLLLERENATAERQAEIDSLLDEIYSQRKELSSQKRLADALIKGKEGEKIKEQRRLYTKKMTQLRRQMKKDGLSHQDEVNKINEARLNLKEQEKKLMNQAKEDLKERVEKNNWVHGVRILKETRAQQKILDNHIALLKKTTGLKKKEILLSDAQLRKEQERLNKAKREALRLIKGRSFIARKLALGKELKAALAQHNIELADEISKKYEGVKQEEQVYLQSAKDLDYDAQRINLINGLTAQRIMQRRERLKTARFLRGQRMLHHLKSGLINGDETAVETYRQAALDLIGDNHQEFDYSKHRCRYLTDRTLAGIYRRRSERDHS